MRFVPIVGPYTTVSRENADPAVAQVTSVDIDGGSSSRLAMVASSSTASADDGLVFSASDRTTASDFAREITVTRYRQGLPARTCTSSSQASSRATVG
jgi:hypothetical protein